MRDVIGAGTTLGYCTNVHAGTTLDEIRANLSTHAAAVKRSVSPNSDMGIGLWLSETVTRELADDDGLGIVELDEFLTAQGLDPFTFNGFPQGDFHRKVVKHRVYRPDWSDAARLDYTCMLAVILDAIGRAGLMPAELSISSLPIGWSAKPHSAINLSQAAVHLRQLAQVLSQLEATHGSLIHVDLEPEPGCTLQRSEDVVRFFNEHLLAGASKRDEAMLRRHLRICHDVCHAAVMYEDQATALEVYRSAGINVGKVQISSALRIDFDALPPQEKAAALTELRSFAEPRYLHQTSIRQSDGTMRFFTDLPEALMAMADDDAPGGEWRVHFHVPIFLDATATLSTTQGDITACLNAIKPGDDVHHFEVETYAWNVLPPAMRAAELSQGIAREMQWLIAQRAALA